MKYRPLGATGLHASEIGYGTWGLGGSSYGPADDEESLRCLRLAFEHGVNFYDTADLYGDGHAEQLLNEAFSEVRDQIYIVTKGGTKPHTTFDMPQDFSAGYMRKALEGSLKRLGTDYVDIYLLHSPTIEALRGNDSLMQTLSEFKEQGLVRHWGISARSPQDAIVGITEFGFELVEVNFNIIDHRAISSGLFDLATERKIGVIARTPLAFGYLSGRLTGQEEFKGVDHRANWPRTQLARWANAPGRFSFLYDDGRRTPAQAALRFCLEFEAVSTVIPGMMKTAEVLEDIAASTTVPPFSREEIDRIFSVYAANEHEFYDRSFIKVPK